MFSAALARYWWLMVTRGVLWVIVGCVLFARPGVGLVSVAMLIGVFILADGLLNVVHALSERHDPEHRWLWLLAGLAGVAIGVLALANPVLTLLVLLFYIALWAIVYIALWAIVTGVLEILAAIRLRKEIRG